MVSVGKVPRICAHREARVRRGHLSYSVESTRPRQRSQMGTPRLNLAPVFLSPHSCPLPGPLPV
jgi:hypothetical protein